MLRFLSIRYRLMLLSLLLGVSLIVTSLVLLNQTRNQNRLIGQLSHNIDVIVKADRAIQTFGNLKYWLTDLALSQLMLPSVRQTRSSNAWSWSSPPWRTTCLGWLMESPAS